MVLGNLAVVRRRTPAATRVAPHLELAAIEQQPAETPCAFNRSDLRRPRRGPLFPQARGCRPAVLT